MSTRSCGAFSWVTPHPPHPDWNCSSRVREKSVGWITSAVTSPAFAQTIALGYLRRGVELAEEVRMSSVDGQRVQAFALSDEGWVLD